MTTGLYLEDFAAGQQGELVQVLVMNLLVQKRGAAAP